MSMDPINIFIADAAFLVREGIKAVIQDKDYMKVVGEAVHSDELKKKLKETSSDLVIIDYEASESFDVDDIQEIIQQNPKTNVLVISTDYEKERVLKAINYGAKGFLLKECDQTEILGAIHAVSKNDKFFCGKVLDIILERNTPSFSKSIDDDCDPTLLTQREVEIVKLMAEGCPAQEIADKLYLSIHTIYTHRKNIMRKLGVTTAAEVILYAINTSLIEAN